LNILDGVTATAAEINILDGVTATTAELNLVDGSSAGTIVNNKAVVYSAAGQVNATQLALGGTAITSTAAEINILDGVTATTAELNILDGVTATAAELNILDGVTATAAELNYNDITTLGTVQASKTVTADASGDVLFPDGDKAIFGAGSDLQIYHTGSASFISEQGTGSLIILTSGLDINNAANTENMLTVAENGAVTLFYDSASKLATSATGVTVTGTVAATAYTGDGSALTGVGGSTAFGAVGTYTWGRPANDTQYVGGATAASVVPTCSNGSTGPEQWTAAYSWEYSIQGSALSGTWRCMSRADRSGGSGGTGFVGLWVRIS
jgi:hypothetical protein